MAQTERFSLGIYFHTLTKMLGQPRRFFSEFPQDAGLKQPLGFLLVSSLFFAGASLMSNLTPNPLVMGGVFFINAMGMTFIAASIGFMVMIAIMGRRVTFARFFSIYALSAGVTLLASWLPFFIWLTEPWKWWLIGTGMVKGFGFGRVQVLVIIGVSVGLMFFFFWWVLPMTASLR